MEKPTSIEPIIKKSEAILAEIKPHIAKAKEKKQAVKQDLQRRTKQLQKLYNDLLLKVAFKKMQAASPAKNADTLARGIAALRKWLSKQPQRIRGRKRRKHAISI